MSAPCEEDLDMVFVHREAQVQEFQLPVVSVQ